MTPYYSLFIRRYGRNMNFTTLEELREELSEYFTESEKRGGIVDRLTTFGPVTAENDFTAENHYRDMEVRFSNPPETQDAEKPLMQQLLDAGYPKEHIFHHRTDLYVFVTPLTTRIIERWYRERGYSLSHNCEVFDDNITGARMYDCAFQYYQTEE